MKEIVDTVATVVKEPVTLVNAGVFAVSMMDIEVGLKIMMLILTGIWTSVKILNEIADFKKKRSQNN